MCDRVHYGVWDGVAYSFLNFNGCTVEVWEWMSDFVRHFRDARDYLSMLGLGLVRVSKRGPRCMVQHI